MAGSASSQQSLRNNDREETSTIGMTIAVSDEKELGTCSFLIIINIININIIGNIRSVLEFVQMCALECVLEFVASAQTSCCM